MRKKDSSQETVSTAKSGVGVLIASRVLRLTAYQKTAFVTTAGKNICEQRERRMI
jgi:hypothetical protein